jgi:hypothetical protein
MMRFICALNGHPNSILEMSDGRLWTRCLDCWDVSPGIAIGMEPEPCVCGTREHPRFDAACEQHHDLAEGRVRDEPA